MLPDLLRWPAVALCLLGLLWLGWRTTVFAETRDAGVRAALRDPQRHDGAQVLLMMWTVAEVPAPDRWVAERFTEQVTVMAPSEGLEPGQTVTAAGTFYASPELRVEARWQEVHRWRRAKEALGLLGFVLALVALPLGFRVRGSRLVERRFPSEGAPRG